MISITKKYRKTRALTERQYMSTDKVGICRCFVDVFLLCGKLYDFSYAEGGKNQQGVIQFFILFQLAMHTVLTQEQTLRSKSCEGTYKSNCTSPKGTHYNSVRGLK